jgi:hypothetical protein
VSVHPLVNDGAYKAVWSKDWAPVIRDARAWGPNGASPGVCNKGGTKQGCYNTDEKVATELQQLRNDLLATNTPAEFRDAAATLDQALMLEVDGLHQRDSAIAQNNDASFGQAVATLKSANALFTKAYQQFPDYDRPTPAPFGGPSGYSG